MAKKIYAEIGGTTQHFGGDLPEGYVEVNETRPSPYHIGKADGTWELDEYKQVIAARKEQYGPVEDQLDEIYHNISTWRARIAAIKAAHPLPE